ncbi:DUF1674 domain-containing protein [Sinorhizobium meliloti]|nr:DUF1674 domain-containing protein [Sinorhizobium meliloti]
MSLRKPRSVCRTTTTILPTDPNVRFPRSAACSEGGRREAIVPKRRRYAGGTRRARRPRPARFGDWEIKGRAIDF